MWRKKGATHEQGTEIFEGDLDSDDRGRRAVGRDVPSGYCGRGTVQWRTGGWQGYQNEDFIAVIDLLAPREISEIGAGFCQDVRAWIWMPRNVEFAVSTNGDTFTPIGNVANTVDVQDYEVQTKDFTICIKPRRVRYVRVTARQFGTIPAWHLGAGGQSFIFIDEIWVNP